MQVIPAGMKIAICSTETHAAICFFGTLSSQELRSAWFGKGPVLFDFHVTSPLVSKHGPHFVHLETEDEDVAILIAGLPENPMGTSNQC